LGTSADRDFSIFLNEGLGVGGEGLFRAARCAGFIGKADELAGWDHPMARGSADGAGFGPVDDFCTTASAKCGHDSQLPLLLRFG
jgi:hypothetical protein